MRIDDRLLFLRYALPCAGTLVKRGAISQAQVDKMIDLVSKDRLPPEGVESVFKVANAMCTVIAKRMGKESIDDEVIRQYFIMEHSKVVDDRFSLMKDFNPVDCKTYTGKVIGLENGEAIVSTVLGKRSYKTIFAKNVKENDDVVVHYDYVIEKISSRTAKKV
jgi:hypothetical protein